MNTRSRFIVLLAALAAVSAISVPGIASAAPGAGIDKGVMPAPEPARPGVAYDLDTLTIFNTGDEPATFEMLVVPVNKQDKLTPAGEWFTFTPQTFELAPGAHRQVEVAMKLPASAASGQYEALLGGRPVREQEGVFVNVGAAARLKMDVAQSNLLAAMYFGALSFMALWAPWSYVVLAALLIAIVIAVYLVLRARGADEYDEEHEVAPSDESAN